MSIVTFQSVDGEVQAAEAAGFVGLLDAVDGQPIDDAVAIAANQPDISKDLTLELGDW